MLVKKLHCRFSFLKYFISCFLVIQNCDFLLFNVVYLWIGTLEWSSYFHWHSRANHSCCRSCGPISQARRQFILCLPTIFSNSYKVCWELFRYFTGHTKNPDGSVQFIKGQTGTKTAINGVIKILTVAVCLNITTFYLNPFCFSFLSYSSFLCFHELYYPFLLNLSRW